MEAVIYYFDKDKYINQCNKKHIVMKKKKSQFLLFIQLDLRE